jgi:hypothetical protein
MVFEFPSAHGLASKGADNVSASYFQFLLEALNQVRAESVAVEPPRNGLQCGFIDSSQIT